MIFLLCSEIDKISYFFQFWQENKKIEWNQPGSYCNHRKVFWNHFWFPCMRNLVKKKVDEKFVNQFLHDIILLMASGGQLALGWNQIFDLPSLPHAHSSKSQGPRNETFLGKPTVILGIYTSNLLINWCDSQLCQLIAAADLV